MEENFRKWAEEILDYYSKRASVLIPNRDEAIEALIEWEYEKLPALEDAIALGKKVKPYNYFATCMGCFIVQHYRRRRPNK